MGSAEVSNIDSPQMTAVILDINPIAWSNGHFTLERTTEALLAFLNAFTMLNSRNQLAVFASHLTRRCVWLLALLVVRNIDLSWQL